METPLLRRNIRTDNYISGAGQSYVVVSDVLLNGQELAKRLQLPSVLWHIARFCDGQTDLEGITDKVHRFTRIDLTVDMVKSAVATLDTHYLLDNIRYRRRLEEHQGRLGDQSARNTTSHFLPAEPADLWAELERAFSSPLGPGSRPRPADTQMPRVVGAVSPHGSLSVSGPCAAHVYSTLAVSEPPELVIVVGYNHVFANNTIETLLKDTVSPLGKVSVDRDFGELLCTLSGDALSRDSIALHYEHSIDMQIPMLQHLARQTGRNISYLPIILSNIPKQASISQALDFRGQIKKVASAVHSASEQLGRRVCVVASGDFAHTGPYYGSEPVDQESLKGITEFDTRAIQLILKGQADDFYRLTVGTTYCCPGPVYFLLQAIQYQSSELLKYYTNWDAAEPGPDLNSFAAIVFRQ